jgi:hypothetical protein
MVADVSAWSDHQVTLACHPAWQIAGAFRRGAVCDRGFRSLYLISAVGLFGAGPQLC